MVAHLSELFFNHTTGFDLLLWKYLRTKNNQRVLLFGGLGLFSALHGCKGISGIGHCVTVERELFDFGVACKSETYDFGSIYFGSYLQVFS